MNELAKGDKVRGTITGKFLGMVERIFGTQVTIRGPTGAILTLGAVLVEPVPALVDGETERVWVV